MSSPNKAGNRLLPLPDRSGKIIESPLVRAADTLVPYLEQTGQQAVIWPEIAEIPEITELVEPSAD